MTLQPFRQKRLEITIHTISWLLVFTFPIMLTEWENKVNWTQYLRHNIISLSSLATFYINYLYLVPRYLLRNKGIIFLLSNALLILLMTVGLHYIHTSFLAPPLHKFQPNEFRHFPPSPHPWMPWGRHLVMMAFVTGLSTAIRVSLRWQHTEERLIQSEREKMEAELKNLKNQLNPHFLLNTLNNIYALIDIDCIRAQNAVQELSKMLRYMLYDNQEAKVPLAKELEFIDNYIALMRIRLTNNVKVSVHLNAGKKELLISPLIFISLIENAFKHGISPTEPSFISISISGHTTGNITCEIMNSNFPKSKTDKSGSGIGLRQVQRRLELSYPEHYEWEKGICDDGKTYISLLTIQTTES